MTIVFLSNYFNHHQQPFSDAMDILTNHNYYFVETGKISEWRQKLGYNFDDKPNYVLDVFNSLGKIKDIINDADAVIIGSAPNDLILDRLKQGKLVIRYSERIYKLGFSWIKWPIRILRNFFNISRYKNYYLLCASAYTAYDYSRTFNYLNKTFKWGYFPKCEKYDDVDELINGKEQSSLLWVGRFIDWKHPEVAIKVAQRLKVEGHKFSLKFIGTGELEGDMRQMITDYNLSDCVEILGSRPFCEVRKYMEQSQIYMFTSNKQEGWGAVLNESMNSACAVVASKAIGSVPFLIDDGVNGLIYKDGDIDDLYQKVKCLLDNDIKRCTLAKNAYQTMESEWNADVAAERLIKLIESEFDSNLFTSGPCSKAKIIKG